MSNKRQEGFDANDVEIITAALNLFKKSQFKNVEPEDKTVLDEYADSAISKFESHSTSFILNEFQVCRAALNHMKKVVSLSQSEPRIVSLYPQSDKMIMKIHSALEKIEDIYVQSGLATKE